MLLTSHYLHGGQMKAADLMCLWAKEEFPELKPSCNTIKTESVKWRKIFSKQNLDDNVTTVIMILIGVSPIVIYINDLDVVTMVNTPHGQKGKIYGKINETHLTNPESLVDLKKTIVSTVSLLKRSEKGKP